MKNKLLSGLIVLTAAILAPLAIVTVSTVGASFLPENQAGVYFTQGIEHLELGQLDLALENLNEAIESDPKFAEAYNARGYVYDELGKFDLAISDYFVALDLGVELPFWTYTYRGVSYAKAGDMPRALADLDEALKLNSDFVDAYFFRGLVYSDQGNSERAIQDLELSLSLGLEPDAKELAESILVELRQ